MKKRVWRVAVVFSAALLLGVGYLLLWKYTGIGLFCPINRFFHIDCPGCGITRASLALLLWDFQGVVRANLLAPLIFLYVIYSALYVAINYIRTGKYEVTPKPEWLSVILLILLLVFGVVRNLSGFQALI